MNDLADRFDSAFANNFYLTAEWATFFQRLTNRRLDSLPLAGVDYPILDNKLVGISSFPDPVAASLRERKIIFVNVLPVANGECAQPSQIEYSIWFRKSYADAVRGYKRSFRKAVRQADRHDIRVTMHRGQDAPLIDRVYPIYQRQMFRLNSFVYPRAFFANYMRMPSSFCLTIEYQSDLIGYAFCVEHVDNLYPSVGGIDAAYFNLRAVNRMYDYFIRYACERGLNIHFGLGVHGSGFDKFKEDAGALVFKIERHPDHRLAMALILKASKMRWYGTLLRYLSGKYPEKIIYEVMPTT